MAFITLNKANLFHNLEFLSKKAGGKESIMAVLKDNAYGHGLREMAQLCHEFGLKKAAVKNVEEARTIADFFEEVLILVDQVPLEPLTPNLSFAAHSCEMLEALSEGSSIHLSIDTGMHRNGIKEHEIDRAMALILKKRLVLKGVFTHFRSADELSAAFFWQRSLFERAKKRIKAFVLEHHLSPVAFHSCNSAGLLRTNSLGDDAYARVGIAMYGYNTLHPSFKAYELKPVLALWAEKLSTRILKKGERVGYGGVYEAPSDELISTYDIGYGDGFFRFDGRDALVMVDGRLSKGRMSMDSFCLEGDAPKVCMFENATALAERFQTICYEIPTKLSPSLKRIVV